MTTMSRPRRSAWMLAPLFLAACGQKQAPDLGSRSAERATVAPASSASAAASSGPAAAGQTACGELPCELFDSPEAAFARVLEDAPAVLAIGETHAPANGPAVPSTTRRFTEVLLPKLEGRASDLVLELWVANAKCNTAQQKQQIKQVASQQRDVTQGQAPTNQSDFRLLYDAARKHKVRSHILVPDCDEYGRILDAGTGDIDAMLSMIARLTATKVEAILAGDHGMVVAYGGAMHNDLAPRKGREAWSFGPRLQAKAGGKYVELDLIVPEFVGDGDVWKSQPWYGHWRREAQGAKTVLFTIRPGTFAMIFAPTPRPAPAPSGAASAPPPVSAPPRASAPPPAGSR